MKRKTEAGIGARLAGMAGAWARERLIDINYGVVGRLNSRIWRVVWWLDSHKQVEHYVDKWRNSLLAKPATKSCAWTEDADGNWNTGCQEIHVFISGTPQENGYVYCPYCGGGVQIRGTAPALAVSGSGDK